MSDTAEAAPLYFDEEDNQVTEAGGWKIATLADADWALKRLGELENEKARAAQLTKAAIERAKFREAVLTAKAVRGIEFFTSRIREYAEAHRAALLGSGKKKSVEGVYGRFGWRKVGGGIDVVDGEALLAWCREQPVESGVLRVKEEAALSAVKSHFKKTGELPPGVEQEPEAEVFEVKPNPTEVEE